MSLGTILTGLGKTKRMAAVVGVAMLAVFVLGAATLLHPSFAQAQYIGDCPDNPLEECVLYEDETNPDNYVTVDSLRNKDLQIFFEGLDKSENDKQLNAQGFVVNNLKNTQGAMFHFILGSPFETSEAKNAALVPGLSKAIAYMYSNPPATTEQYVAYALDSAGFNIAQPAYAQAVGGLGFNSLLPILSTWIKLRNLAYLFFVIMFVAIGFMIMFRQKIGSQAVITVQQAIPQIIISMLAVTFSFAIAGLLIDLMYVSMYLLLFVFGENTSNRFFTGNPFSIGAELIAGGNALGDVYDVISEFIEALFGDLPLVSDFFGFIGGITGAAVFAVAMAIGMFRLFFELLQTYVSIIISIVTAPIALMLGAVPGKSHFKTWVMGLVGNLAAFPTVLFVLLLYESITDNPQTSGGFMPPFLIGNGQGNQMTMLLGIGMILILPTIVKEAKQAFGAGKGGVFSQFSGAIKDAVNAGWKGDELIKGVGLTNLKNYGISGQNFGRKVAVPAYGAAGFVGGGARAAATGKSFRDIGFYAKKGWKGAAGRAGVFTGEGMIAQDAKAHVKKLDEAKKQAKSGKP